MRKAFNVIKDLIVGLLAVVAIGVMLFTIVSEIVLDRTERSLLGYKAFIVLSDSMSATDFEAGDLILVKEVEPVTLKEGDIIAYTSQAPESYGETITHKIRSRTMTKNGSPGFITYGTTTGNNDEFIVTYSDILGKYQGRLPKAGTFLQFLKTIPGYIVCILIPFMLLITFQVVSCAKEMKEYKREQMDDLRAERERLEAERQKLEAKQAELEALKEEYRNVHET